MMKAGWIVVLSTAAWAQVAGPTLGLTPDGSHIRPIYGMPGAGIVGGAIDTGGDLGQVAISPQQNYALATQAAAGIPLVIVPGRAAQAIPGASANPDRIVISPRGSSAALWFDAARHFQIVSGLPGAPAVRELDASFLGTPSAIAVSDDGRWLAGSWANGVYVFGPDGAANPIQAEGVLALAFFSQRSDLALVTATRVFSIADLGGSRVTTVLHQSPATIQPGRVQARSLSRPVAIAASFDNGKLVIAGRTGTLLSIDLATGAASTFDCACAPEGLFGMGGALFRLTSPAHAAVKLFDASEGAVFVVPSSPPAAENIRRLATPAAAAAVPQVTIGGIPSNTGFDQQPAMTISIASPYPSEIDGTATLSFASSAGGDDQMIQFVTGGRTASFTIPAGSTQANFSGKPNLAFSTGTVAGTIAITLNLTSDGADVTPTPPPSATYTTNPTVPFIQTVTLNQTPGGVTVLVKGFSSSRDMVSGLFHFAPAQNSTIAQTDITVPLDTAFATWYQNGASNAFGSEFLLTMPFPVKGNPADIIAVTVTLTNSKGASNPASE